MILSMTHVVKQWIARALALCVVGPICAMLASRVLAPDGSHNTTFLTGHAGGVLNLVLVLVVGLGSGIAVGRLVDRREGFLHIAFVFGWVAWTIGRMGEVFRIAPESGTLIGLSIESLIIGAALIVALVLMTNPSKGVVHGHSDDVSRFDLGYLKESLASTSGLISMVAALIAGLVIAMLFGQTDLPGQSVGVGFGAGVAGGLAGALAWGSASKSDHKQAAPTPFGPLMIGVMLCGVVAPIIGFFAPGTSELSGLVVQGDLPGYLIVSPIAWSMGALLGVPMGHSWVEHSVQQASGAQGAKA